MTVPALYAIIQDRYTLGGAMESHIDRILNGEFVYDHPSLDFPEKKLELTVFSDESTEGEFCVLSDDEGTINGTIVSSDPRMRCDKVSLEKGRADIHYVFNAKGLEEGQVVKGNICVISEEGEYKLPFSVSVSLKYPDSSQGPIKNLFHFTNLARNHFSEAVNIFYSHEMINVFHTNDLRFRNLYRAFSVYPGSGVNVEEFLIAVHKKSPVIFTVDPDSAAFNSDSPETGEIRIRKSGWGYTRINVKTQGSFIRVEKDLLLEKDFDGDTAVLRYFIDREALHRGKNIGAVFLRSFSSEISFRITADLNTEEERDEVQAAIRRNQRIARLMETHIAFRLKEKDLAGFCHDAAEICEKMTDEDPRDILPRLIMAHIYLMEGRDREAGILISLIDNEFQLGQISCEAKGFFKYLKAIAKRNRSYSKEMSEETWLLYKEHPGSMILLWVLIYLDEELGNDAGKRIEALSSQFASGCRSPLLYIEILRALSEDRGDLRKAEPALVHSLYWGVKRGVYLKNLIHRIISLSYGQKMCTGLFQDVLKAYYEKYPSPELLEAICSSLIRDRAGRQRGDADFRWFEEGIKHGLKITRLYESYLNTVREDYEPLMPEPVLLYFSIGANIGDESMACLYANMIRNQRKISDILRENEQRIAAFAVKEAENRKISRNLATIYEYVAGLAIKELDNRFMLALSPMVFCHEIRVEDPKAAVIVSVENGFNKEHTGTVTGGKALVNIYGGESELIVEYRDMRRSVAKKGIQETVLMNPARFVRAIKYGMFSDPGQAFYSCGSGRHNIQVTRDNEGSINVLASSPDIDNSIRNECFFALIRYYSDNDRFEELDRILEKLDVSKVSSEVRAEIARLYVSRGFHRKVFELIKEYGAEGVDPVVLVRLASCMIAESINIEDPTLINIAFDALKKGKYDEIILRYLCDEYQGTVKDLRDIWTAASSFGTECVKLEEKILSQMLYSGSFVSDREEIVLSCINNNGRERVTNAFLDYLSYEYFVKKSIVDSRIFKALTERYRRNGELSDMASLAVLKFYSEGYYGDREIKKFLSPLVDNLLNKNMIFEFFREYREYVPALSLYHDRTFVEYRTEPFKRVTIHYCIFDEETERNTYIEENMDEICQGVYTRDFVLFFGEKLQYYITEEEGNEMNPTKSEEIERDLTGEGRTDSRYDFINDMLLSESVNDDPSLEDLMEQYLELSEKVEEFF